MRRAMTTKRKIRALRMKKRTSRTSSQLLCAFALAAMLGGFVAVPVVRGASSPAATATKVPHLRVVEGMVCARSGTPVQGAVVYLQDTKSLAVKSYLSDDQGRFHFRQLSMNLDYDLWAELNGKRSKTKSISQFNSKPDVKYRLKLPIEK
jgi:hypothetical protein